MPDFPTTCAGCGLKEDHKMCVAHGTDAYMNPEHPAWGNAEFIAALRDLLAARQERERVERELAEAAELNNEMKRLFDEAMDTSERIEARAELAEQERDSARKLIDDWAAADRQARASAAKVLPAEWLAESKPGEGDEPDAAEIVEELVRQIAALRQQLAAMRPAAASPPPRLPPRRIKPEEDDTEQAARDFAPADASRHCPENERLAAEVERLRADYTALRDAVIADSKGEVEVQAAPPTTGTSDG